MARLSSSLGAGRLLPQLAQARRSYEAIGGAGKRLYQTGGGFDAIDAIIPRFSSSAWGSH